MPLNQLTRLLTMTRYSKPAIQFSESTFVGSRFTVPELTACNNRMSRVLRLVNLVKRTTNPDDWLWIARDESNVDYEVRNWWLRKCCDRTG